MKLPPLPFKKRPGQTSDLPICDGTAATPATKATSKAPADPLDLMERGELAQSRTETPTPAASIGAPRRLLNRLRPAALSAINPPPVPHGLELDAPRADAPFTIGIANKVFVGPGSWGAANDNF